jgi:microcystin-dependent protein
MPANYSKIQSRTGVSVGTIISVPKSKNWSSSSNTTTESNNWEIDDNFPGWLPCDGREVSKADYRALYAVIGAAYGETANTFFLPDYRSRKLMGTGPVNGNTPGGISLTPTEGPGNSTTLASPNEAGSEGGVYSITTIRQLPPSSEITPISPSNPASIGGAATDTFNISTFSSSGFGAVTAICNSSISGNVSWSAGPVGTFSTPVAPPHYHEIRYAQQGGTGAREGSPYAAAKDVGFMGATQAGVLTYDRFGAALRTHAHYLNWGYSTEYASYGNDNTYGSSGLVNIQDPGGSVSAKFGTSYGNDNNRGTTVNKTVDVVNDLGVFFNLGNFTLSAAAASEFDAVLGMRLQAAEEMAMMQPYYRLKYIIKAY